MRQLWEQKTNERLAELHYTMGHVHDAIVTTQKERDWREREKLEREREMYMGCSTKLYISNHT